MHLPFDFIFDRAMALAWLSAVVGHGAMLAALLLLAVDKSKINVFIDYS